MPRSSPFQIELAPADREALEATARCYTSAYSSVVRAKIVLFAAQGLSNDRIAQRLDLPRQVVSKWRKRYWEAGLAGLEDRPGRGRPRSFSPSG